MSALLGALVLLPLGAAAVAALLGPVAATRLAVGAGLLIAAGAGALALQVAAGGPVRSALGGWQPPLGIGLRADGISAGLVLLTSVVGLAVSGYASGSAQARGGPMFWPVWLALWSALHAVYLSADLFNTYVALELVGLTAVGLVTLGGQQALAPALRYLFVAVMGSLAYLLGVALLYAETGTLQMADLGVTGSSLLLGTVVAVMALGMALKTALFPLHGWLPPAHAAAPAAVSPLLSALVVKASFYVLVRVWFDVLGVPAPQAVAHALGALGAVAVCWGGAQALRQERLKRVVAYSTVAQVGYLFLLFPLAVPGLGAEGSARQVAVLAWTGALALALSHGLAKAAMFLAAGTLAQAHGTDRLVDLHGAVSRMPATSMTLALTGVVLAGLPPTLGFVGKWHLLQAALGAGQWWWVPVLLLGGLLTFGYTARAMRSLFDEPSREDQLRPLQPVALRMQVVPLLLAATAVALGLGSVDLLQLLTVGSPLGGLR